MKKLLFIFLICALCFSMAACGGSQYEEETGYLNGSEWKDGAGAFVSAVTGTSGIYEIGFHGNKAFLVSEGVIVSGDFKVKEDYIEIKPEGSNSGKLYYTYENGEMKLFRDEEKQEEIPFSEFTDGGDLTNGSNAAEPLTQSDAESIIKQEVVNMCCEESRVESINIDYGTIDVEESTWGYTFTMKGTYYPVDAYGTYSEKMKFWCEIEITREGQIEVVYDGYDELY